MKKFILLALLGLSFVFQASAQFGKDISGNPTFLDVSVNVNKQYLEKKLPDIGFKKNNKLSNWWDSEQGYSLSVDDMKSYYTIFIGLGSIDDLNLYNDKEAEEKYQQILSTFTELYGSPESSEITYSNYNSSRKEIKEISCSYVIGKTKIKLEMDKVIFYRFYIFYKIDK